MMSGQEETSTSQVRHRKGPAGSHLLRAACVFYVHGETEVLLLGP